MHISYSRVSCYTNCPKQHHYRYIQGLELKKKPRPLRWGSDFHKMLELRNDKKALVKFIKETRSTFSDLPEGWKQELGEDYVDDLKTVFGDYINKYKDDTPPTEVEHKFEFPLFVNKSTGEVVLFVGYADELYTTEAGEIIGEHKTFGTYAPDLMSMAMDTQVHLYAKARQLETGVYPIKVRRDYIKSTPASEPIWLEKSQRFSLAKNQNITIESFVRAHKKRGLTVTPEVVQQAHLYYGGNEENLMFRREFEFDPKNVELSWQDFVKSAKMIVRQGKTDTRRNITRNCSWCSYRDLCYGEFSGADIDYILDKDYQQKIKEDKNEQD